MNQLIQILRALTKNPKVVGYIVVIFSSIISKKIAMSNEETTTQAVPDHETAEPLFLPRGTVRAIFALALLGISAADFMMSSWSLPEEFHAMTIAAVAYYIGYRSDNARTKEIKD